MHNNKVSNLHVLLQSNTESICARTKRVLVIGGLDPSGGAGIVADISTLARLNCRPAALATAHTIQGLAQWGGLQPMDTFVFRAQAQNLLDGPPWEAVKVGALGSAEIATEVSLLVRELRARCAELPVVVDPVLRSTSGGVLGRAEWMSELIEQATVICPNLAEQQELRPKLTSTPGFTLVTDQPPGAVLLQGERVVTELAYTRQAGNWRGTGCRLTSMIAAALASGLDVPTSCAWALHMLQQWISDAAAAPRENVERTIL